MRFRPAQAAHRRSLATWVLAGSLALVWITAANAQRPMQTEDEDTPAKSGAKTGKGAKGAKTKQPANENVTLETKDGVQLHVEYLPGMVSTEEAQKAGIKKPEECVPVILLHMAKGSGADWRPLARSLQRMGCAVIIPDLRGHGQSTQVKRGGATLTIDQATMRRADDFEAMVTQDMEAVKKFVIEKNNDKELNLRKLCVVGAEMGAAVAINWAAADWSWPPLATGPQGQDVNGLVLLTPVWSHKGMTIVNATKHADVQSSISVMILVGNKDTTNFNNARRLHGIFQKSHVEPPKAQIAEKKDLFFFTPATSLQGTKMLGEPSLGVEGYIRQFIQLRLINKSFPWAERRSPLN